MDTCSTSAAPPACAGVVSQPGYVMDSPVRTPTTTDPATADDWLSALSPELLMGCLEQMGLTEVLTMSALNKAWSALAGDEALWRTLTLRDWAAPKQTTNSPPDQVGSWRETYERLHRMHHLKRVKWERVRPKGNRPTAREGHALAPYGSGAVLFGGWADSIRNTVEVLIPNTEQEEPGQDMQWCRVPMPGRRPHVRYGHSLTRCGPNDELLVVFGGMTSGGYRGGLDDVAVLRPRGVATASAPQDDPPEFAAMADSPAHPAQALEWYFPEINGPIPDSRGYHPTAVSEDGTKLYVFGGISRSHASNQLAVLDVTTWTWDLPPTTGDIPCPRFGSATTVYKDHLWVVGGGLGGDLLRSGDDLNDVHTLDLSGMEWTEVQLDGDPPCDGCMGREAGHCRVGGKLLLFGGSLDFHDELSYIDLDQRRWGQPEILGRPPTGRISGRMAVVGDCVYLFGGWHPHGGNMGDLHRLKLVATSKDAADAASNGTEEGQEDLAGLSVEDQEELLRSMVGRYNRLLGRLAQMAMMGLDDETEQFANELEETAEKIMELKHLLRETSDNATDDAEYSEEADSSDDGDEDYDPGEAIGSAISDDAGSGDGRTGSDGSETSGSNAGAVEEDSQTAAVTGGENQ